MRRFVWATLIAMGAFGGCGGSNPAIAAPVVRVIDLAPQKIPVEQARQDGILLSNWLIQEVGRHWALPTGIITLVVEDHMPAIANGDAGWHTSGMIAYVSATGGEDQFLQIASHELAEIVANPSGGSMYLQPDGSSYIGEIADPVGTSSYRFRSQHREVFLSDFVWPSYFQAESAGPWDQMGELHQPLLPERGCFQQIRRADGSLYYLAGVS